MTEMSTLCDQLCTEARPLKVNTRLARDLMCAIHPHIRECSRETYIWIFTHAAALSMQIDQAMCKEEPLPGERWAEFISSKLRIH